MSDAGRLVACVGASAVAHVVLLAVGHLVRPGGGDEIPRPVVRPAAGPRLVAVEVRSSMQQAVPEADRSPPAHGPPTNAKYGIRTKVSATTGAEPSREGQATSPKASAEASGGTVRSQRVGDASGGGDPDANRPRLVIDNIDDPDVFAHLVSASVVATPDLRTFVVRVARARFDYERLPQGLGTAAAKVAVLERRDAVGERWIAEVRRIFPEAEALDLRYYEVVRSEAFASLDAQVTEFMHRHPRTTAISGTLAVEGEVVRLRTETKR